MNNYNIGVSMTDFDKYLTIKQIAKQDEDYMAEALIAADRAKSLGDSPVGALLVMANKQLTEHDTSVTDETPINTATINVLRKATDMMPRKVANSILYCTVEPNSLDVLTAHGCNINEVIFGCYNLRDGFVSSSMFSINLDECGISYKGGVLAQECYNALNDEWKGMCSVNVPQR